MAPGSTEVRTLAERRPVETAEDSDRSPVGDCDLCEGSGVMSWQQPYPSGELRTIEMDCPNGCGDHWKYPAAERDRVIEQDNLPERGQRIKEADAIGADFVAQALEGWGFR